MFFFGRDQLNWWIMISRKDLKIGEECFFFISLLLGENGEMGFSDPLFLVFDVP